ncbi:MAG: glutamyl-tRNA reductase [Crocinitomicaceae bacterium]|nr:glutamyl-tRNA reductase [Crocinitomicaceae bacterium]
MLRFNVIAFTHHTIGVDQIGNFHLEEDQVVEKMQHLKSQMNLEEIMYLSTCNRVEFIFVSQHEISDVFRAHFLNEFNADWDEAHIEALLEGSKSWNGINAVNHLMEVACSLDSMVIGEREIITQMKDAFEFARLNDLSGDTIRIVMQQVIQTAKKVYTETEIARKPVSVVSLAYHKLVEKGLAKDARVLFVGAGVTNTNMGRFLKKHGFENFTVFNRSKERGEQLADLLNGTYKPLSDINQHQQGFDLMVTCTAAADTIITNEVYQSLLNGESSKKIVIDLAVPADLDESVKEQNSVDHISVDYLKSISENNLAERKKELIKVRKIIFTAVEEFKEIFKLRQVEIKMRSIPERVKEIRTIAVNEVFCKDLEKLDEESREVVDKILNYMEKKYVSVPMLVAKEMFSQKDPEL